MNPNDRDLPELEHAKHGVYVCPACEYVGTAPIPCPRCAEAEALRAQMVVLRNATVEAQNIAIAQRKRAEDAERERDRARLELKAPVEACDIMAGQLAELRNKLIAAESALRDATSDVKIANATIGDLTARVSELTVALRDAEARGAVAKQVDRSRIDAALKSLAKAWPVLAKHAPEMDGEFNLAHDTVKNALDRLLPTPSPAPEPASKTERVSGKVSLDVAFRTLLPTLAEVFDTHGLAPKTSELRALVALAAHPSPET